MTLCLILITLWFGFLAYIAEKIVFPPWNFPKNIPTIPFYVIFLPSIIDIDQTELYDLYLRKPLEKHGAAKLFFGSRWNIIVTKPQMLAQIFKDEDTFAKSGNQKKIPHSVIAAYTGDNVISAHGKIWRTYRSIVTNGLQHFDDSPIFKNAKLFTNIIEQHLNENSKERESLPMSGLVQRLCLDNISQVVLGFDFASLSSDKNPLHNHLMRIKKQIFHPFFLTFPFFDHLPIPARKRGFADVEAFRKELVKHVDEELVKNYKFEQTTFAASDLIRAYNNGVIDRKQLTDNLVILLVAGHENPQLLLTTSLYLLAKHSHTWQKKIRNEIWEVFQSKKLSELPLLNSFLYEAVRILPPLNTIINRCTTKTCLLGNNVVIPRGVYVGYNNFGSSHDTQSWGPDADEFKPQRWGQDIETINKNWKYAKNTCKLSSFHGGRRACLGEKLGLVEVRITLAEMLRRYEWILAPDWEEKMTPAGPLGPLNLKLKFKKLNL
ncbi:probable Cytochrome P450-DIT2 [Zygosaccharomyces bailii ISA1307]|uniref:ZYBA0S05-04654g1_1 n=1 Tax=Zygosaccharomyces bailii (strain CLIB 213 / ATCC 58445 / CBS 680 / BCRC 21525 / NBRC 1098 / NCYC 1416 / NRRL Y-2227) TaxID=1333698 RepID=A0A8J2X0S5_ZYGB2|nr:ZYBA0S05-04654g1_1 [Zygosaccharomyces bailii CLIB 213]CDH17672.1 probable Cytochrome P450-DIT2 [Zygosaccharomyces bailii ISA1307]